MKLSKILTIITVILALVISMVSCSLIEEIKGIIAEEEHVCESACAECGLCTDAECTEDACASKCQGHESGKPDGGETEDKHVCESACPECGKCLDATCYDAACAGKCEGHKAPVHSCTSKCPECDNCLDAECDDAACADKCEGHEDVPAHECESVCPECSKCLDATCGDSACADKCEGHAPAHSCESVCPECGKCLDATCSDAACAEKCQGHVVATTPVITVIPPELEINAGDDIELLFGVSVSDEGDENPILIIEDDDGFDNTVEGTYTITYYAINKFGNEAYATRTVIVNKALSALTLEVRANRLGENKWAGNLLNFKNNEYVTLSGDMTYNVATSGVFYNSSNGSITLSIPGGYGVAAIIDANGVVIEGRDGANNKFVDAKNPNRDSSGVSTIVVDGKSVTIADAFAQNMIIPAGGYAIVVQNGYCGTTVDSDGRGFMNYNVIYQYGNVVRLLWADSQQILTPYVDQAPVISGTGTTVYAGNSEFVLEDGVLAGVTATDDNGTFATDDDVTITVTIADNGGFDINVPGEYNITLSATDGTHTTSVIRVVEVNTSSVEIKVGDNGMTLLGDLISIDEDIVALKKYYFVIYTPEYNGGLNWTNGWGEAFVLNQYGEIIRIYDGANGKYYDLDNQGGIADPTKCTAAGYLTEAYDSLQAGEYLVVAPNGNGNVSRAFFLNNRTIGAKMTIPGITFAHKCESVCVQCGLCLDADCTDAACANKCQGHVHNCEDICDVCAKCTSECDNEVCAAKCDCVTVVVGSKSLKILGGTIAIDVAAPTLGSYNFVVYTYAFKAQNPELSWNNGWSQAFIINEYGQVVRIYDGVSGGKYFDANNFAGIVDSSITTAGNILKDAYASLSEGETLILGANGGMNNNAGRGFLGGVRTIGLIATIPGVTFQTLPEHACESACSECGKCMDATCIMPACLAKCACHRCESICAKCEGCLDPACTEKACETKCSCHDCESLCAICGGCKDTECTNDVCAKKCVCIIESTTVKYFAVNGTSFMAAEGKWLYNSICGNTTEPKAQNYKMIIFDKNYKGSFTTNSYGAALVVDANGVLVKGYAWDGYYTADGKAAIHYAVGDYATVAFAELKAGEVLIIFPNDGSNAADSARTFAKGICDNWANTMGKTVTLTGFTFDGVVVHECESVCPQCGLCLDAECTEPVCASKCAGHSHNCDSACATCGKCLDKECTEDICATKCNCMTFNVNGKTFTAVDGKWIYNQAVTATTAQNYSMIIYDKNYTGAVTTNAYGAAIVLDQYGKLIKIYDGANGWFYALDNVATGRVSAASAGFTTANYATVAWDKLAEGETLIIFPNDGATNAARGFALGLRNIDGNGAYKLVDGEHPYFGKVVSLTGITFADPNKTITIGSKTYTATEGKWLYNTAVSTSNAASYAIIIYDKNFTGTFTTNGYGVAVVLGADGKVARVYDGANAGYTDATTGVGDKTHGVTVNNFATLAWESLQAGETLVILPNGGSDGNAARQVGLDCRYLIGQKMSITGFTFN